MITKAWIYDTSTFGISKTLPWEPVLYSGTPKDIIATLYKKWKITGDFEQWKDSVKAKITSLEKGHPIHEILERTGADSDMIALAVLDYVVNSVSLQGIKTDTETINCKEAEENWLKCGE